MFSSTHCRFASKLSLFISVVVLGAAAPVLAQHGGHGGGGAHVSAPPHMSAPPRMAAPPPAARGPIAPAPRIYQALGVVNRFVAPVAGMPPGSGGAIQRRATTGASVLRNTTIGFPSSPVFHPGPVTTSGGIAANPRGLTFYGDGHDLWTDGARVGTTSRTLSARQASVYGGLHRRGYPLPRGPIYFPVFFPVGIFSGFGWGFGFGGCDPYWGWAYGCEGFGYGGSGYDFGNSPAYYGPSEPDYIPVPSDANSSDEQDEVVLYLKDGTVYLISDYWLADNQIHYVTSDGAEHRIDLDQVDLQKSVDVNAKRGVTFTLRPAPTDGDSTSGAASDDGNAPAAPAQNSPNQR
jgi:hypothetical protein